MGIHIFLSSYLISKGGGVGVTYETFVVFSILERMALGYCGTRVFPPFSGMRKPLDYLVD
jgi:hypothetical protein